jgi:hypothetical protein
MVISLHFGKNCLNTPSRSLTPRKHVIFLEVVSKPQIRFKGKASRGLKTERTRQYVSISIGGTTPPLGLRWGFETTSNSLFVLSWLYYFYKVPHGPWEDERIRMRLSSF